MSNAKSQQRAAEEIVRTLEAPLLKAIVEPTRLEILKVLLTLGPSDVGAIANKLPQDRSVISRHLRVLTKTGVVREERSPSDGRLRIYALDGVLFVHEFERICARMRALAPLCCGA